MYHEENPVLGYFESKNGESIKVLDLKETVIDNEDEIFVIVEFKNDTHNLLLQTEIFPKGESPYESGDIEQVPYFIIENYAYYLDDVFEVNKNLIE